VKINQASPSLPVSVPPTDFAPTRPQPQVVGDDFEVSRSSPVALEGRTPELSPGAQVIDLARSVLGQNAHDLKLANGTKLGKAMQDWVPDTVNCANFVSGLLIATGQMPQKEGSAGVSGLVSNLKKDPNFTTVDLDHAQPGDVVAFEYKHKDGTTGQHVVVFEGRDASGKPVFLGSDNVNKDGTQRVHEMTGVPRGWKASAVMHYVGANPNPRANPTPTPTPTGPAPTPAPSGGGVSDISLDRSSWLRGGSSGPAVEDLQNKLKAAGFDPGPIDGQFGPKARAAVIAFQQAKGLMVDGIVGPQTKAALLGGSQHSRPPPAPSPEPTPAPTPSTPPTPTGSTKTARELEAFALKKHGPEFVKEVHAMAGRLGVKPEWILAVMKNESGMDTSIRNKNGGATGLIQFMPATAKALGTSTDALAKMSATEQLKYVEKFYAPFKGKLKSGTDLYLATFWPAAVGKADGYKIGGAEVARVNPAFDLNKNGQITAGEFRDYYQKRFPELAA
jgi:Putative peptidoglycan binding domain/Transglycosylase SLT domain